ncbi:DUF2799 domain-containing protein [Noviherbaspirillum galbum]|uniref:DUF2799 domain-containing protein n=1 Tax=Noviherbaspirillum galbum TaxID=2709383 RepID=A0A6B3SI06_9BURK|nr:DUF2799 domain-containing protein [Noviherbaspirillum galbum]NEX60303.1 DUF2799 domain-containing protein [Noviherbaspirillum galbum]
MTNTLPTFRVLLLLTAASLAGGCASLSPEQCRQANWEQIGYADGAQGLSGARVNDHAKACAESGVRPDLNAYLRGRSQGLFSYCQPENGFTVGRRGSEQNAADCPASMRGAFIDNYQRGQQVHAIEQDLAQRRGRQSHNATRTRNANDRINAIRTELARSDLSSERRNALLTEFNRLVEEKNTINRDNAMLAIEVDRLQIQLNHALRSFGR